jgi:hypothetical protein
MGLRLWAMRGVVVRPRRARSLQSSFVARFLSFESAMEA